MNSHSARAMFRFGTLGAVQVCLLAALPLALRAQHAPDDWQNELRRDVAAQNWTRALTVVDAVLADSPQDDEARAWRGRVLLWSGDVKSAESTFLSLTADEPKDPDMWEGLANVYERESRFGDALDALSRATALDAQRADLHTERAGVLRTLNRQPEARQEFLRALQIDPASAEAKEGLLSVAPPPKQELRIGTDEDLFNYTSGYQSEWVALVSQWTSRWTTAVSGNFFQRGGPDAGKFVGSITRKTERWGAITAGGAAGHDEGIIPRAEAFFGFDRGWRLGETGAVRGLEATYDQHWYWYSSARVLTLSGGTIAYLPRDWTWSISATGARSAFPGLPLNWRPSGTSKLTFPVLARGERTLSGNVFFATGAEDFALVDQLGRFSSQTWGGGFRLQLNARQDVTGYGAFQQRTRAQTDTSFGFSYGIHF